MKEKRPLFVVGHSLGAAIAMVKWIERELKRGLIPLKSCFWRTARRPAGFRH